MDSTYLVYKLQASDQKSQILATGVALLFAFMVLPSLLKVNLIFTFLIDTFGAWSNDKP